MWYNQKGEDIVKQLDVNPQTGLSSKEANERLQKYGKNKLKEKPKTPFIVKLLAQFNDILIYILLAAAILSIIMGDVIEAVIIIVVVLLNGLVGAIQEDKAEAALEALKQMTTPKALVRRDGKEIEIETENIVPGDIVELDAGRYVPADIRILSSNNLQIEESALTGESVPSEKDEKILTEDEGKALGDRSNMAYMSTLVTYGRGTGVVVENAIGSEIGKIAKILDEENNELTPLQKRLEHLGKILGIICIAISIVMFALGLIQGRPWQEMLLTAISLAVAAIPEGLVAIVSIVLAIGVTKMSKINAIVKKLPAVETLGSVNVICSDKTGTLTQNKMTVVKTYTYNLLKDVGVDNFKLTSEDQKRLVKSFVLSSDATSDGEKSTGDPTEVALIVLGNKSGLFKDELNEKHKRVSEKPFDSDRKLMSTLNKENEGYEVHTKGAIDNILKISNRVLIDGEVHKLTDEIKEHFLKEAEIMSNQALRVLGVAYKPVHEVISTDEMEENLIVIGFTGMIDPPRAEVKPAIDEARRAGIKSVMITGDHKNTAFAIAKELGIAKDINEALTGAEIDTFTDEEFNANIDKYRVFARVSPEHKVKIVRAFKSKGNIVSMTGDGVNDAPSLKFADIGVAMGITGTDVSKGAADMILTDDNFSTIVAAIKEGRNIYANIKKAVIFLLSCNLGEVIAIFISVLLKWPIPLAATQILWVNLVTDTFPALALGMDPEDPDAMKRKPRSPKESFFSHGAGSRAIIGGTLIGLLTLAAFFIGLLDHGYNLFTNGVTNIPEDVLVYGRTMAFIVLASSQLFYALSMRHSIKSIFQVGLFKNMYLIGSIIIGIGLQVIVVEVPFLAKAFSVTPNITPYEWLIVIVFSLIPLFINEIIKFISRIFDKDLSDNEF